MVAVANLLDRVVHFLSAHGIGNARGDAELLLAHLLECLRTEFYLKRQVIVDGIVERRLWEWVRPRAMREPLQYIFGEVDFYNVKLEVDRRVLIPRFETETLVAWLVEKGVPQLVNKTKKSGENLHILDLGTGSGAIAIALAKCFPQGLIAAVDRSSSALEVAQKNATLNRITNVKFLQSDWFNALRKCDCEKFDIIVSNPPYLTRKEFENAQDEVKKYEPERALIADDKGLRDIYTILGEAPLFLKKDGFIAFEVGVGHAEILQKKNVRKHFAEWKF
jgi:release factor glutamine methyltransferase